MTTSPETPGTDYSFHSAHDFSGYAGEAKNKYENYDQYKEAHEKALDLVELTELAENILDKQGRNPAKLDTSAYDPIDDDTRGPDGKRVNYDVLEGVAASNGAWLARYRLEREGREPSIRYDYREVRGPEGNKRGTSWAWIAGSDVVTGADFRIVGQKSAAYVNGRLEVIRPKHEYGPNFDFSERDLDGLKMTLLRTFRDVAPTHKNALPVENPREKPDSQPQTRKRKMLGFLGIKNS
jgi:hypothetical protein